MDVEGEIGWRDFILISLFCTFLLAVIIYVMRNGSELESPKDLLLAECRRLADIHLPGAVEGIDVAIIPVGPAGRAARAGETLIIWKSNAQNIDVHCIGSYKIENRKVSIRRFTSNGEPINFRSKR